MTARIVYGMPRAEYEADPSTRWSCLRQLGRTAAHYQQALAGQGKDSDALKAGRAIDCRVFEPETFAQRFAVWGLKDEEKVRRGKVWDAFEAAHAGQEIITDAEATLAKAVADAVREKAAEYVTGGAAQVAIFWEHDGHRMKSLIDYLIPGKCIVDLKTTADASPKAFGYSARDYGYWGQAATYREAVFQATGEMLPFVFLAAEKHAPWLVQPYLATPAVLAEGRREFDQLLETLRFCEELGEWPGYGTGLMDLQIPPGAFIPAELTGEEPNLFE